jgi:cell division transport system ATP-binding protein
LACSSFWSFFLMDVPSSRNLRSILSSLTEARPGERAFATEEVSSVLMPQGQSLALSETEKVIAYLHKVTKTYDKQGRSLSIDLDIRQGDFLFVTGISGAGKSTLLKMLYGEEKPTSGEVVVDGTRLNKLRGHGLSGLRRRIGVVFQDYKLLPRRTVAENVAFALQAQNFAKAEIRRRLLPTLKIVGLEEKAEHFPEQLSGGEQQRVAIARAIVHTPVLLLADEPTGNLDAGNTWSVLEILRQLNDMGVTIVVTTHDETIVQAFAKRVVTFDQDQLVELDIR